MLLFKYLAFCFAYRARFAFLFRSRYALYVKHRPKSVKGLFRLQEEQYCSCRLSQASLAPVSLLLPVLPPVTPSQASLPLAPLFIGLSFPSREPSQASFSPGNPPPPPPPQPSCKPVELPFSSIKPSQLFSRSISPPLFHLRTLCYALLCLQALL